MKRRILVFIVAFALLVSLFPAVPAAAANYGPVVFGTTYPGSIAADNTSDRYSVVLPQAGRLSILVARDGSDAQVSDLIVRWFDPDGKEMRSGAIAATDFPYGDYMDLEPGTYCIEIAQGWNATGTYAFRVDFVAAGNDDVRPNNAHSCAQRLTPGKTVKGFLSHQCTNAFYQYTLAQEGRLSLNIANDGSEYRASNLVVRWFDSIGAEIRSGTIATFPYGDYMDLEAGVYYIEIAQNLGATGTYSLTAQDTPAAVPTWTLTPSSIVFTSATEGYSNQVSQSATMANTGTVTLTSVRASITSGSSGFEILTSPSSSLAAGNTATVSVRPKTGLKAGTYTGTLTVSTEKGGSKTVSLSFTVNAPEVVSWTLTPSSISFTSATEGYSTRSSQSAAIANTGNVALTSIKASITSGGSGFEIVTSPSSSLAAGNTTTVSVRPKTGLKAGTYTGTLTVSTEKGGSKTVSLSFTVNAPEIVSWTLSPSSIAFTAVTEGYSTRSSQSATLTNTGNVSLTSIKASITSGSSNFEIVTSPSSSLAAGKTATVSVRPKTGLKAGTYTGTLAVSTEKGGSKTVSLSFTVNAPEVISWTLTPSSIAFTAVTEGYSTRSSQSATLTNTGNVSLTSIKASITGGSSNFEIVTSPSSSLSAGKSATISVRPKTGLKAGTYTGTLTVSTEKGGSKTVSLSFTVNAPEVTSWTLSPSSISFKSATEGYSNQSAQSVTMTNTGTTKLTTIKASITSGSSSFEIVDSPSSSLSAGKTTTVSIRPKTGLKAGTYTGTLTVSTEKGGSKTVALAFVVNAPPPPPPPPDPPPPSNPYKDISPKDWYYDAVMFVYNRGLMIGMDTGLFEPNETLTREQAITIIARLSGDDYLGYSGQSSFDDVDPGRWSAGAISWARATGVTNGVGNNRFAPTSKVTLDQFEVMLMRHFNVLEKWKGNSSACSRANAADLLYKYVSQYG